MPICQLPYNEALNVEVLQKSINIANMDNTYSAPLGVNTGLSASLRGSISFSGARPLRFFDELLIGFGSTSPHGAS